jgi:hypothetical protein
MVNSFFLEEQNKLKYESKIQYLYEGNTIKLGYYLGYAKFVRYNRVDLCSILIYLGLKVVFRYWKIRGQSYITKITFSLL